LQLGTGVLPGGNSYIPRIPFLTTHAIVAPEKTVEKEKGKRRKKEQEEEKE